MPEYGVLYQVTLTFQKEGKNNHLRKRYTCVADSQDLAIEKVKRTIRCRTKTILNGHIFVLQKESAKPVLLR